MVAGKKHPLSMAVHRHDERRDHQEDQQNSEDCGDASKHGWQRSEKATDVPRNISQNGGNVDRQCWKTAAELESANFYQRWSGRAREKMRAEASQPSPVR